VLNVLLQVLDDGRLTDGQGRTVDFTNTVIILTSNLGAEYLLQLDQDGKLPAGARDKVMKEVRRHFRPEFLNRLDEIIIFNPLGQEQLRQIVKLQVAQLATRLEGRNTKLQITDHAADVVLKNAWDPIYGARPIRRYLEKHLVTHLSRLIISGELQPHSMVTVDAKDGNLTYNITPLSPIHFNNNDRHSSPYKKQKMDENMLDLDDSDDMNM
jgi:ATP-dependent Clp protease ATP-binding subunit ClpB